MLTSAPKPGFLSYFLPVVFLAGSGTPAADKPQYNRDVRPILAENCFACHGPDSASRKAGLRLDQREAAVKAGALVPGRPDKSGLVERIFAEDAAERMPPPRAHKTLSEAQKQLLKSWIAGGAEYQPHWSLLTPRRPALPTIQDTRWPRNPIDHFILARLEEKGLQPTPEADRYTLARRLSLDLIGLPPGPDEVQAFVEDRAPDAYERYVDRLLQSPHWGEHRGRYWLDLARYADTFGINSADQFLEMSAYRDGVLNAFNANQPYDQFTIEQLAGDLLPGATVAQQVASGFNRCHMITGDFGEEFNVLYTRDRTETTAQVWLGLTANCAVCHDHKFDPFTTRDFYALSAFFNNTAEKYQTFPYTPPLAYLPRAEDQPRFRQVDQLLQQQQSDRPLTREAFDQWLADLKPEELAKLKPDGLQLHGELSEGAGQVIHLTVDGAPWVVTLEASIPWSAGKIAPRAFSVPVTGTVEIPDAGDFETGQVFSVGAWVCLGRSGLSGSIVARMDDAGANRGWELGVEDGRVCVHLSSSPEDALQVWARQSLEPQRWYHVLATYDGSGKAAGVRIYLDGASQPVEIREDRLQSTIRTETPLTIGQSFTGRRMHGLALQDLRLYGRALCPDEVEVVARLGLTLHLAELLAKPSGERQPHEIDALIAWWQANPSVALVWEKWKLLARGITTPVMQERAGEPMAHILQRGEFDKRLEAVRPATPHALPALPPDLPRNRLGLARWLVRSEHPLTARVTVNRFWQEVFGAGLVRTSKDFGVSGELPSHPELLDWLAVDFRESGWDVKRFFKLLVTSATYRQQAITTPDKRDKDPDNRLLSRSSHWRLDAEMIRDYALAASGLLVLKVGGPSVKPTQPDGLWETLQAPGSKLYHYSPDTGDNLYRRSLYTFWRRSLPPPAMEILNAPSREVCTVRRERTNTPVQALVTLNDPQFIEAARHLAQKALLAGGADVESQLDYIARRVLIRLLTDAERPVVDRVYRALEKHYRTHPAEARQLIAVGASKADPTLDPATLAAWTMVVNQLMNLDEVLCK
jgi:hypothetical protein